MRRAINERLQHILQGSELNYEEEVARTDVPDEAKEPSTEAAEASDENVYVDMTVADLEAKEPDFETMNLSNTHRTRDDMMERAKYIPLRLSYEERRSLRLVEALVNVCDYTTCVDVEFPTKSKRRHVQLQNICALLSGIVAASDYTEGQAIVDDRNFAPFEESIQNVLEVARRYKIMNPEKMRTEYGKLIYLMQDASSADIQSLLGISVFKPVKTVFSVLEELGGLELLRDKHIEIATQEILPDKSKSRHKIDQEIKAKQRAIEAISEKYRSRRLSSETIQLCLYSICDNNSFLNSNRLPIDRMIEMLKKYFSMDRIVSGYSLAIEQGAEGARLTHNHQSQYRYVLQSLTLWSEIVQDMFRLWYLSEEDLLSQERQYVLAYTGQGLQRVQESPKVYRAMHEILYHTQQALGDWVGSSVIHLGDRNVPNTLTFIDKYTQVSRILGPIVNTIQQLEAICDEDTGVRGYVQAYGGLEKARVDILHDFFKHAFDGSGADNFYDAGSCIDGRLTSAWNWCSQLANKPYHPLFRLTGFLSFDGEWAK